jgi:protein-tyrosine phosphatase
MELPPARVPGRYVVGLVCLGNICRSPTADVVLSARVTAAGLADRVRVLSCGTGDWHVGQPMDHRAAATLTEAGYDPTRHRAQTFTDRWHQNTDVLLAMDESNLADLGGRSERTLLFGDFDPETPGAEVPDPYYGGPHGFEEVLAMVERTCTSLLAALLEALGPEALEARPS